jgi:Short C-terminal domain
MNAEEKIALDLALVLLIIGLGTLAALERRLPRTRPLYPRVIAARRLRRIGSNYVWIVDWASGARRYTAFAVLNRRLASGEIDRAEYEEKRKLIGW